MKWKLFFGAAIVLLTGCNKEPVNLAADIEMINSDQSGCNGWKSTSLESEEEYFIIEPTGEGIFRIEHFNTMFNCCLPQGIEIEIYGIGDTIFFSEKEKVPGECRCICPYDISADITNTVDDEYVLCFIKDNDRLGAISLFFDDEMYERFTVSDLSKYP
ncbi:MAG: hypothetical protein JW798_10025 [Prolixibacteraceae bacterium]|nr:hypothetical protein [Prolixibacteraceae bacterium]